MAHLSFLGMMWARGAALACVVSLAAAEGELGHGAAAAAAKGRSPGAAAEWRSLQEGSNTTGEVRPSPGFEIEHAAAIELVAAPPRNQTTAQKRPFPPTAPAAYWWWMLILYMFVAMAIVCDDYLVPTVDVICEKFGIPEDVAGATLMAFACNGPELLTNVCGIFITHTSVGMGTVVGSAIFNVMVIVGVCPLVCPGGTLYIPMRTFMRDVVFSAISIVVLAWALPVIDLLRGSVLFGMCVVYAIVVAKFDKLTGTTLEVPKQLENEEAADHCPYVKVEDAPQQEPNKKWGRRHSDEPSYETPKATVMAGVKALSPAGRSNSDSGLDAGHGAGWQAYVMGPHHREQLWDMGWAKVQEPPSPPHLRHSAHKRDMFRNLLAWIWWLLITPIAAVLYVSVPNVHSNPKWYVVSFLSSMTWLALTAFVICLGSDQINYYWGIPQSFLGLTLVAVGTSFPNMFASMVTAKAGRGPIAISNALGSNVQNIFLVLGLPIWVRVLQKGEYVMEGSDINASVLWMAATLAFCCIAVVANKGQLTKAAGWLMILVYIVYVVQTTLSE